MNTQELSELLEVLCKYNVETYEYKELKVVFRFPKIRAPKAMLVVDPKQQVAEAEADDEEEELVPEDKVKTGLETVPAVYKKLFQAVPRKA